MVKISITGNNIPLNKAPKFVISLNPFSAGRKTLMLLCMIFTVSNEPIWSTGSHECFAALDAPWAERDVTPYRHSALEEYQPNVSNLLPRALAETMLSKGMAQGAAVGSQEEMRRRFVFEFSVASCLLEGGVLDIERAQEVFEQNDAYCDKDAMALFNHKPVLNVMLETAEQNLTADMATGVFSGLMVGLVEERDLHRIRSRPTSLGRTKYFPPHRVSVLSQVLTTICTKAAEISNPIEAAFYLWLNLAYLHPFIEGNKRTSRVCANRPLFRSRCAPMPFIGIGADDYRKAMLSFFETGNVSIAVDLFEWSYRHTVDRYAGMYPVGVVA